MIETYLPSPTKHGAVRHGTAQYGTVRQSMPLCTSTLRLILYPSFLFSFVYAAMNFSVFLRGGRGHKGVGGVRFCFLFFCFLLSVFRCLVFDGVVWCDEDDDEDDGEEEEEEEEGCIRRWMDG